MKTNAHSLIQRRWPMAFLSRGCLAAFLATVFLASVSASWAATFPGNARLEVLDPTAGLSWDTNKQALTVQCWFKIVIPSGANLSGNMTLLVDRTSGDSGDVKPHAYRLWYDVSAKKLKFSTRGSSQWEGTLLSKPYLDRWYHVAVVRGASSLTAYIDGQSITNANNLPAGSIAKSTNGVSIGGWSNTEYFRGDIQEVAIYQAALQPEQVKAWRFVDQRALPNLYGYYKLGSSTNASELYGNLSPSAPPGTDAIPLGGGNILFEPTDEKGEQSLFDSQVNGGRNALAPLSGLFTWQQSVLRRPVPGIPFDFMIGYSPAAPNNNLGPGWSHSLALRVITEDPVNECKLLTWQGGIEVWDRAGLGAPFRIRHGEYRGELRQLTNGQVEWTTPERLVYRFRQPNIPGQDIMDGRLLDIRDYNGNTLTLLWNTNSGYVTNLVDSAGGRYLLSYDLQSPPRLTNLAFGDWQVNLTYGTNGTLATKTLTNTSGAYELVNATWRFFYDSTNGLLNRIVDPLGITNTVVQYDDYGRRTVTKDALGQSTTVDYNQPNRRQITTTDKAGFRWISTLDRKGRTIASTDPLGNQSRFSYDLCGNRTSTTDPLGNTTLFSYDERGNVTSQTNALGEVTIRTYHPFFNKALTEIDALGWATTNGYDTNGNLISRSDALGRLASFAYTSNGLLWTLTNANGQISASSYDTNGLLIAQTDGGGFTTRFYPNNVGWNLAMTNALGQVTTYAYNLNGNLVGTVDALNRVFTAHYDADGNLLSKTDAKGQATVYGYDKLNRVVMEVDRAGAVTRYGYTPRSRLAYVTNALGFVTTHVYDAADRETQVVDPLGNTDTKVYDAAGNLIATLDALGHRSTRTYDRLNRVIAEADPLGNTTRTTFDAAGRAHQTIAPDGTIATRTFDGRGRRTRVTDAEGSIWSYGYDGVGNITNVTDALGGRYTMTYGPRNERTLERNQDNKEWHYTYDALERLATQTEPNGIIRTIEYDAAGRILFVTFNTGRVNSFLYDENDNPVVLSRTGSGLPAITQMSYDEMDRVRECRDAFSKTVQYAYDAAGRQTALTYPGGKVLNRIYDAADRLTTQVFTLDALRRFTNSFAYDAADRLIRSTYPNGIVQTNQFDDAGQLAGLSHSTLNIARSYTYDRNGNLTRSASQGGFAWPVPTPRQEQARYTPAARLVDRDITISNAASTVVYTYDASGNMTNAAGGGQSWALSYDEDNRTTAMRWVNGALNDVSIANRYDAFGRRIAKTQDGFMTGYVLDLAGKMERILCDINSASAVTAWYVHAAQLAFKISAEGSLTCYHADAQGNVVALTDAAANSSAQYAYTPYGRSLGSTSFPALSSNPFLFVGVQGVMEDLPGLFFMRARYYSAEAGVFLSTDPVKHIGPTWLPLAYAYANSNPLRYMDPLGESWLSSAVHKVTHVTFKKVLSFADRYMRNYVPVYAFTMVLVVDPLSKGQSIDWQDVGRTAISTTLNAGRGALGIMTGGASDVVIDIADRAVRRNTGVSIEGGIANLALEGSWRGSSHHKEGGRQSAEDRQTPGDSIDSAGNALTSGDKSSRASLSVPKQDPANRDSGFGFGQRLQPIQPR